MIAVVREARGDDVASVLELWAAARSGHASTADSAEAVERLLDDRPGALLVAYDDEVARGLWGAAGYELDREIGRFVRNL